LTPYSYLNLLQERYPQPGCLKVYRALCRVICGRTINVDWTDFAPTDWHLLGEMAARDSVDGLVYQAWHSGNRPIGVPTRLVAQMGAAFRRNEQQFNSFQTELFTRIEPALAATGLKMVVLKGAALAGTLYLHPGMRPMHDLDCLVPEAELPVFIEIFLSLGYTLFREVVFTPGVPLPGHHLGLLYGQSPQLSLELHYGLTAARDALYSIDLEWFFSQTEPLRKEPDIGGENNPSRINGQKNLVSFTPAAQLLHLVIHLMIHHGEGEIDLLHYYDIHLLVERWGERINWDDLLEQSRRMKLDYVVFITLQGCAERFGTHIPEGFKQEPNGLQVQPVKAFIETRNKQIFTTHLERYLKGLSGRSVGSRVIEILRIAFPNPEFMRRHYELRPAWLWPAAYPLRWIIGIGQIFRVMMKQKRK
jgi:hypothetical protein